MKRLPLMLFFIILTFYNCFAQTLAREQKIQQAITDAQKFKLNKTDLKQFRYDRNNYWPARKKPKFRFLFPPVAIPGDKDFKRKRDTIDYYAEWFMPTKQTTRDTLLLKDSTYVQYYRAVAYQKTAVMRTTGHYLLLAGIIISGIMIIVGTILVVANFRLNGGTDTNYFKGISLAVPNKI